MGDLRRNKGYKRKAHRALKVSFLFEKSHKIQANEQPELDLGNLRGNKGYKRKVHRALKVSFLFEKSHTTQANEQP